MHATDFSRTTKLSSLPHLVQSGKQSNTLTFVILTNQFVLKINPPLF